MALWQLCPLQLISRRSITIHRLPSLSLFKEVSFLLILCFFLWPVFKRRRLKRVCVDLLIFWWWWGGFYVILPSSPLTRYLFSVLERGGLYCVNWSWIPSQDQVEVEWMREYGFVWIGLTVFWWIGSLNLYEFYRLDWTFLYIMTFYILKFSFQYRFKFKISISK